MIKCILILFMLIFSDSYCKCVGRFVNPISDICWSCLFPITICGMRVSSGGEDTSNPRKLVCKCEIPVLRFGLPISFWEPARLIDVTRIKFCLVNMGGLQIGRDSVRGHGDISSGETTSGIKRSFYQVHYYKYPVLFWLELLTEFVCMEKGQLDIAYITEFDPLWNDDETAFVLNPEAVLFGNPVAQAACAADAVAATAHFPLNAMFWCAGCQGGIYPFTGHVSYHVGAVQASLLVTTKMLAKMHREGLAEGTSGEEAMCKTSPKLVINKSQYKQQMTYPSATTGRGGCKPLGRTSVHWEAGKEKPYTGEDFGYLIWRKRNCCLL